ncbi:MAG TPA: LLM class flavin-dependent oxidoreductase [Baekduia sp.]|uniref:LLM class flavin-dependent oxidoreductase n=1 Tax=Baekduia sp. TaxID=2600305 RepID=UPI002D76A1CA|nr:LLM class flavin-dependent oxidoreductase [Baekduia sp.]HET6507335.1 LLM class flavin-dependent oxidoreductase [Baekduia sp.]
MADYGHEPQFGIFVTPDAAQADAVLALARLADAVGLDLVTFQDHPYQAKFLDTWTLLSVVAAQTTHVRVAPNVLNLPLRPPAVLARAVASLDRLSGGRVDLGLGAGAFWDGVAAMGGPRRTPGEAVDALSEAIEILRALWDTSQRSVRQVGEHYAIVGAHPGPAPAHDVEIWVGAYKPRMLRLTGTQADGWLPSMGYIELEDIPEANARIDDAAAAAGRPPSAIRRMLNLLAGGLEPERLAELNLRDGISTFILAASSDDDVRRFAEETAPAVRELVLAGESRPLAGAGAGAARPVVVESTPLAADPTPPPARRLSAEQAWDEATRPTARGADAGETGARRYTPDQQAAGRHLIDVHDHLRAELDRLREIIEQVARGETDATTARQHITRMTIRQNNWTLGTFCETYCRVVTQHHTLEDRSVFPHLRRSDPALQPVLDRLEAEHVTIADLLERVDQALVSLVAPGGDGIANVNATVDLLTDALLSHFSYEERELIEPLARHGFY